MVTQTVVLASHPQQYGGILQLCDADDVVIQSAPAVETRDGSAVYTAVFTDAPAATYRVKHLDAAGTLVWTSAAVLTLTTATFTAHDSAWLNVSTTGLALEATAQSAKTAAESADGKLTAGRLSRIDRLPDVNAGAAGGLSLVGSEMTLSSAVLAALFSDTDTTALVNSIIARVESDLDGADLSTAAIAVAVRNAVLDRILASNHEVAGSVGKLLQNLVNADATVSSRATPAQVLTQITAGLDAISAAALARFATVDTGQVSAAAGSVAKLAQGAGGGGGAGDAEQSTSLEIQETVEAIAAAIAGASEVNSVSRVSAGGAITLYVGDDCTAAAGTLLAIRVADVGGAVHTKLAAIGAANLSFGASRASKAAGQIKGTVVSLAPSGSGASLVCVISVAITAAGVSTGAAVADDYEYQISQRQGTADDFVEISGALDLRARRVAIPS